MIIIKRGGCFKSGKIVIARSEDTKQSIENKRFGLLRFARNDGKLPFGTASSYFAYH
ncbi:MAG: hypothetical protein LBC68_10635 [Prevotellaceae bacterium]|nr:hypothetical protein [Prevotellaceae bacterium]